MDHRKLNRRLRTVIAESEGKLRLSNSTKFITDFRKLTQVRSLTKEVRVFKGLPRLRFHIW